jgi:hypothetical protein
VERAAQHRELVVQHQDLQLFVGITACEQGEQPERAAQHQVASFDNTQVASEMVSRGVTPPRHG